MERAASRRRGVTAWSALLCTLLLGALGEAPVSGATVSERLEQYGPGARERLRPYFETARIAYPPAALVIVGLKQEARLEVYASKPGGAQVHVVSYPILAASGAPGPKLRAGDLQVPEGLYRIALLNPNSRFHLSLRVDYPNAFDRRMAAADGRSDLGGDIMIHGNQVSIGCLAMGDPASEELFVLVADTGLEKTRVILAPSDLPRAPPPVGPLLPAWTAALYREIRAALTPLPPSVVDTAP